MAALQVKIQPMCEPVPVALVKQHLRITGSADDGLLGGYISAARIACEIFCRRRFINATMAQFLDSFPYFTDTVMSQMAYPPAYYSLPRYSTTLWNYSQMIKLFYSRCTPDPVTIIYVDSVTQTKQTLTGTNDVSNQDPPGDFLVDLNSEPPRLFPLAGGYWPSVLYVPNAVEIDYVCGYNNDATIAADLQAMDPPLAIGTPGAAAAETLLRQADVPQSVVTAIMLMVGGWYENRESVSPLTMKEVPFAMQNLLWNERVEDLQPTRG